MNRKLNLLCGAGILGLAIGNPAMAQQTAATVSEDQAEANVIIVTARKVEESVQDIPLAITAFSAKDIADRSINDLEDVALLTPGLVFEDFSNGGYGVPTIRGANQFAIAALETNVSVFLDGIYIPRQYAFDLGSVNLERIEVVKGPQSSLYGANAFAGAINYVTTSRSMTDTMAHAEISASEDGGFELIGKISAPLVADVLSVRLALGYSKFGGGFVNNHPDANAGVYPGTNGKTGGYKKESVMVGASLKPFDALKIDFDYYNFDTFSEGGAYYRIERGSGDMNCSNNRLFCGKLPSVPIPGASGTTGIVKDPRSFGLDAQTEIYRVAASWELTDNLSLAYQYGNIEGTVFSAGHSDKDPLVGVVNSFSFGPVGDFQYESHEARIQYEGDSGLYVMAGVFAQDGRDFDLFAFGFFPRNLVPFTSVPAGGTRIPTETLTDTKAVFGRIAFPLMNERLIISAEGRYTDEDKKIVTPSFSYKDSYFTPRVAVDFKVTPDNLIYASAARGVKSGGINTSSFAGLIPEERFYGRDTNWTYELGSKNSFGNGRGLLNVALFYIDWSNLQLPTTPTGAPINTATIVTNLGGAKSKGAELETHYEIFSGFKLNAGLAYIDATYVDGTISARLARAGACDNVVCNANGDVGGNDIQRTAKWQWNVGAAYDQPISDTIEMFARVDVAGQSKMWTDETNTGFIEPRTLVNARLGIRGDNWSAAVWAKNLLNETYVSNAFYTVTPFGTSYVPALGNPRRVGATLAFDF